MAGSCPRPTVDQMIAMPNEALAGIDPVVMNLVVASGIESLAGLDIDHYVDLANQWAAEIRERIPAGDANFRRNPALWKHDLDFSRLALLSSHIGSRLGVRYVDELRDAKQVRYWNPNDQFLTNVMDLRRGTCASMPVLWVALAWRLGWPVSLACCWSHFYCRFDDGRKTFNIETTLCEDGCFNSPPDEWIMKENKISQRAVDCGSDLRSLSPRETLAIFIAHRGRHFNNVERFHDAERDYLLARSMFPQHRHSSIDQLRNTFRCLLDRFEQQERGHPIEFSNWLQESMQLMFPQTARFPSAPKEINHVKCATPERVDSVFEAIGCGSLRVKAR